MCTPLGTISLDVFYRIEFQTCKTSCCSREVSGRQSKKLCEDAPKRPLEGNNFYYDSQVFYCIFFRWSSEIYCLDDVGAYLPFQPSKRSSAISFGSDGPDSGRKSTGSVGYLYC